MVCQLLSSAGASVAASGLSRGEFAVEMGTSQSRLSTYLAGKVVPAAALLVRRGMWLPHTGTGSKRCLK